MGDDAGSHTRASPTPLGPVVGGLLEHFWWGLGRLINVPVIVVLLAGGIVLLPEQRNPAPGPSDLPSVGLSLVGMLGLVYAVKEGAASGLRVDIVVAGVVGVAALTLFVRRQLKLPTPVIDVRLFCNRAFLGVVPTNLLSVLGLSGLVFFLSQFFQLVDGYNPLKAGLAELPATVTATVFGVLAGTAVLFWSRRAILATGLALVGVAMVSLTLISPSTAYPQLGIALFVVGAGLGLAYAVANDVILASVPRERAGAAAAISETLRAEYAAWRRDARLHRHRRVPRAGDSARHPDAVASHATDSLAAANEAAAGLPADQSLGLLTAAKIAFTDGLAIAAGVGSGLLLVSAVAVWLLLKPQPRPAGAAELGGLDDPGGHRDPGDDRCIDAAGAAELVDKPC